MGQKCFDIYPCAIYTLLRKCPTDRGMGDAGIDECIKLQLVHESGVLAEPDFSITKEFIVLISFLIDAGTSPNRNIGLHVCCILRSCRFDIVGDMP